MNALDEYVRPVPAVVVAPLVTSPLYTARPPLDSDGRLRVEENVDDAVENSPLVNPITVDVELYPALEVNGKAKVGRPRDDVAVSVYPPAALPTRMFPNDGAVVSPVPPYIVPIDVVALTTPLFACSGPLSPAARFNVPMLAVVALATLNDE